MSRKIDLFVLVIGLGGLLIFDHMYLSARIDALNADVTTLRKQQYEQNMTQAVHNMIMNPKAVKK